jgi:hypothetical protein
MTTTTLFANPYNISAHGFYFTNIEDYETKSSTLLDAYNNSVDEFELDYIDGGDSQLFTACSINQTNLSTWFNDIELLQDNQKVSLYYLLNHGYDLTRALEMIEEPMIAESNLRDAAEELFDELYLSSIPENIRYYIDYEKFARDCDLNSELVEFEYNNTTYSCTNANNL